MTPVANESRAVRPFGRLRRWALFFIALVAGLLAMRYGWNALADRRIAELARRAHAMGQPLLLSDFTLEVISDADNAAVPIGQALTMLAGTPLSGSQTMPGFNAGEDVPVNPQALPSLEAWVKQFQAERSLIRSARGRPQIVWNRRLISPVYQQMLPQVSAGYSVSNILLDAADEARAHGDDAEAIEDIYDLLLLQKAIDCSYPVPVTHMVSLSIGGRAVIAVRRSAMDLQISDNAKSCATRQQVKGLIADLLDERSIQANGTRAFFGEAAMVIDAAPYEAGRLQSVAGWLFEPMYKADAMRIADVRVVDSQVFQRSTWPAAKAVFKPQPAQDLSLLETLGHPMVHSFVFDPQRWTQLHFHHLAERRIAAIMLALRLYEHDHGDALPHTFVELVPKYLPMVPSDPFDPSGKPLRYLPLHDPPILYSVGENGADDGGSVKRMPGKKLTSYLTTDRWQEEDAVFSLKPIPRLLQAQDHQGQVDSGKGQQDEK